MTLQRRIRPWRGTLLVIVLSACGDDPAALEPPIRYTVEVSGEHFVWR